MQFLGLELCKIPILVINGTQIGFLIRMSEWRELIRIITIKLRKIFHGNF